MQKEEMKKYKGLYKSQEKQVKLVKDKLLVGSKVVKEAFVTNPLISNPCSTPKKESALNHTTLENPRLTAIQFTSLLWNSRITLFFN